MKIVIFTYDRPDMLKRLLKELEGCGHDILIIDDGSDWDILEPETWIKNTGRLDIVKTDHEGKKYFYHKWMIAHDWCLNSPHDYFLFMSDDVENVNMDAINNLTKQGWGSSLFAINTVNDGRTDCWGYFRTGQNNFKIEDTWFAEVGFVDCGFVTNRFTLEKIKIEPVPESWFDREGKSSGVGHQLTTKFRKLGVKMMNPVPTICHHGDHESKMHPNERKKTPLKSI